MSMSDRAKKLAIELFDSPDLRYATIPAHYDYCPEEYIVDYHTAYLAYVGNQDSSMKMVRISCYNPVDIPRNQGEDKAEGVCAIIQEVLMYRSKAK